MDMDIDPVVMRGEGRIRFRGPVEEIAVAPPAPRCFGGFPWVKRSPEFLRDFLPDALNLEVL